MAKKKKKIKEKKEKEPVKKVSKKEQIKTENKILRNFLIGVGVFIILILIIVSVANSSKSFTHEEVKYNVVREGNLVLYNTQIPVVFEGRDTVYNFYLRNDPRTLDKEVPFRGQLIMLNNVVLNSTSDFNCDGFGVISVANLANLYTVAGANVIKDSNATCSDEGNYMYINLRESNETSIRQTGLTCYDININNCQILEATERFMAETFTEMNKLF